MRKQPRMYGATAWEYMLVAGSEPMCCGDVAQMGTADMML
jgi:hypothetical protein